MHLCRQKEASLVLERQTFRVSPDGVCGGKGSRELFSGGWVDRTE